MTEYMTMDKETLSQIAHLLAKRIYRMQKELDEYYDECLYYYVDCRRPIPLYVAAFFANKEKRLREIENTFNEVCEALNKINLSCEMDEEVNNE